jgi:hypothetical protein
VFIHFAATKSVTVKSIRVATGRASTARHRPATNHPTRARIAIKTRKGTKIRTRKRRNRQKIITKAAVEVTRIEIRIKAPPAHHRQRTRISSIPAATAAQSTKAKTKTEIATRIDHITKAAPADRNTKARIRIAIRRNIRARAHRTRTNRRPRVTTIKSLLI